MRRTVVYIDAFNLYHGCLKRTAHRWLDLVDFTRRLLPNNTVEHVHVFGGVVTVSPLHDPWRHLRQATYFRALDSLPDLTLHRCRFVVNVKTRTLVTPLADGTRALPVYVTEEKGVSCCFRG